MESIVVALIQSAFTFAGIFVTVYFTNRKTSKEITKRVDKLVEHDREQYLSLLRLTIMSSEMPIGERIVAGQKYLERGGNGDVKKFLEEHFNISVPVSEASHYKR